MPARRRGVIIGKDGTIEEHESDGVPDVKALMEERTQWERQDRERGKFRAVLSDQFGLVQLNGEEMAMEFPNGPARLAELRRALRGESKKEGG